MGTMGELEETPSKEQTVVSPELVQKIESAREAIVHEGQDSQAVMGRGVAEIGYLEALWKTGQHYGKEFGNIQFKQLKAQAALVLSLIPFIGEGKAALFTTTGIKKGFEAGKTAFRAEKGLGKLNAVGAFRVAAGAENVPKASSILGKAMEGSVASQAGLKAAAAQAEFVELAQTIGHSVNTKTGRVFIEKGMKAVGKETAKAALDAAAGAAGKTGKVGKFVYEQVEGGKLKALKTISHPAGRAGIAQYLDLTPDIPLWLTLSTGAAEMVGVHGADAIPAALQIGKNMIDMVAMYGKLSRDVFTLTMDRLAGRKTDKTLVRAAATFVPSPAPA